MPDLENNDTTIVDESANKFTLLHHIGMTLDACVDTFATKDDLAKLKSDVSGNITNQLNQLDTTLAALKADVEANMPSKVSELTNDSNYQTATQVSEAITAAIPTNVSQLTNDTGFITAAALPTKVSELTNDSGFTTNTGTVTSVKVNGVTKNPTSGAVDVGNVVSSITINGTSVSPASGVATLTSALSTYIDAKINTAIGEVITAAY